MDLKVKYWYLYLTWVIKIKIIRKYCWNTGKIPNGLHADPTGQYLLYAIGTNLIKADTRTGRQTFMIGHGNNITCMDFDRCGRYIVTGQMNYMGFKVKKEKRNDKKYLYAINDRIESASHKYVDQENNWNLL